MQRNLLIGLPITLLCLALQAAFTFSSVQFYMRQAGPALPGHGQSAVLG